MIKKDIAMSGDTEYDCPHKNACSELNQKFIVSKTLNLMDLKLANRGPGCH